MSKPTPPSEEKTLWASEPNKVGTDKKRREGWSTSPCKGKELVGDKEIQHPQLEKKQIAERV